MALVVVKAKDIIEGDTALCPDIGCWALVNGVAKHEGKVIVAVNGGPPGTVALILDEERRITVRRGPPAAQRDSDTLIPVVGENRRSMR